jgi:hypothetical protein
MDVWLHKHFFPQAWHVALVIDPVREAGGFFGYQQGQERFLQPWHYQGFFELGDESDQSVVNWTNLMPEPMAVLHSA